jgi:hypothetical protein
MHNAVMAEFGDLHVDDGVGTDASREAVVSVDPDMPLEVTRDEIELVETTRPQEAEITLEV